MSNILIQVNGSITGDGFLVAPDNGTTFAVPLTLSTTDGSKVSATIDASPNGAGVTLPTGTITIDPSAKTISIFATAVSNTRGDTVIHVHAGGVTTSFSLTAISRPQIWFRGRFEARFATDNDWYNDPKGTYGAGNEGVNPLGYYIDSEGAGSPGWTWTLEGEPDFVPSGVDAHGDPNSVPTTPDKPVGRVVRFNNPVALRSRVAPVVTTVNEIHGTLASAATEIFTAGDPVIGATVNLGPNTYFAANFAKQSADPWPSEPPKGSGGQPVDIEGYEPMALFELHIDGFFSGKSATLGDRPRATGVLDIPADEKAAIGFQDLATFSAQRLKDLQADYALLTAADIPTLMPDGNIVPGTGSAEGRNLARRIFHLTPDAYDIGVNTSVEGWNEMEEYTGQVNDGVTFPPNTSSVMSYLGGYSTFTFTSRLFTFHSDELCGYVHGSLTANTSAKTLSLQMHNSTFGKNELKSMGSPATFRSAFWVVMDGFLPYELGIVDVKDNLVANPTNKPHVTFSIDPPANTPPIVKALVTEGQLTIQPFTGLVLTTSVPPPNAPQRILYPFTIQFTGTDGFVLPTEFLTLTAKITVNGKSYSASAPLELTTAANPYVTDADKGNLYTSWLSTDLRVFSVDDDKKFFGKTIAQFYPPGAVKASYPVSAEAASTAATAYIADLIKRITPSGAADGDSFEHSLTEAEDATGDELEYLQVNRRTKKAAFNFAICRVRIRGTTPPPPPPKFTTQARNCRVFFRAFNAQNTVSTFDPATTYRSTPIVVPDVSTRVPLPGVVTDAKGHPEFVTIPFFAVDRVNLAGPADLTKQKEDTPNVRTISPTTGKEVDTYYGCWLDMNQPTRLFPQFAKAHDFDNKTGYFNSKGYALQSINAAFTRAPHQCLIAEIAFDDVPIPPNADSSTSDKLAQRNLAYIDGPNPGATGSRRMPHPFQIQASTQATQNVDELMFTWGNTPAGSTASIYLPGVTAAEILALADSLYPYHTLSAQDPYTITTPTGPVTFVPIPRNTGLLAGLLTVDLPPDIRDGDLYTIVVRQVTDATQFVEGGGSPNQPNQAILTWRRVLGAFQINLRISTKQNLLAPEEHRLALFRWIAENVLPQSRWYPVIERYIEQLAGRVTGFGGNPVDIPPSETGDVSVQPSPVKEHHHEHHEVTGKVSGLAFDHFGDFEGFELETGLGELHRFHSREDRVLEILRDAFEERIWVTVVREPERPDQVRRLILRVPPPGYGTL